MRTQRELAGLIRKGLRTPDVRENSNRFIEAQGGVYGCCALGLALVGLRGPQQAESLYQKFGTPTRRPESYVPQFARALGVPVWIARRIHVFHSNYVKARTIATKLEHNQLRRHPHESL